MVEEKIINITLVKKDIYPDQPTIQAFKTVTYFCLVCKS